MSSSFQPARGGVQDTRGSSAKNQSHMEQESWFLPAGFRLSSQERWEPRYQLHPCQHCKEWQTLTSSKEGAEKDSNCHPHPHTHTKNHPKKHKTHIPCISNSFTLFCTLHTNVPHTQLSSAVIGIALTRHIYSLSPSPPTCLHEEGNKQQIPLPHPQPLPIVHHGSG